MQHVWHTLVELLPLIDNLLFREKYTEKELNNERSVCLCNPDPYALALTTLIKYDMKRRQEREREREKESIREMERDHRNGICVTIETVFD